MKAFREYLGTPPSLVKQATGLFQIKGINSPKGLMQFAESSLDRAETLAAQLKAPLPPSYRAGNVEIRKLDELSDTLCRCVDLAAFLRIAHPSSKMTDAAQQVHELLFGLMSELNTNRNLYKVVNDALNNPEVQGEERKVGEILKHDFLKSGVQFDSSPLQQQKFVDLSNSISIKGQQFLVGCSETEPTDLTFSAGELSGVSPILLARLAKMSGPMALMNNKITIPSDQPHIAEHVLATAVNPETRRRIWHFNRQAPESQTRLLDEILKERLELAQLAGYSTFADYELGDKLMGKPENVLRFLKSLASTMRPLALNELKTIGEPVDPWDYTFNLTKFRSQMRRMASPPKFELANVLGTISDLTERLYGLRLQPGEIAEGEVWDPEVRRIDVIDTDNGNTRVGMIYCDLMSRPGKQPNPAHFTIQCARRKFPGVARQLPIIALVCDFESTTSLSGVLLEHHEVQTLFHEMGHAIHSMVGRTDLHNVAGTRCATDFVELPSILFEKFASDPQVLCQMKPGLDAQTFLAKQLKLDAASKNCEVWHQLTLSFLDQALHGGAFSKLNSGQKVANEVVQNYTLYPKTELSKQYTQNYAQFGHLISYGATYYSYLFDRCLASMAWETLFQNPERWELGGRRFKDHVLKWGGAKDGQECLENLLNRELDHSEVASYLAK